MALPPGFLDELRTRTSIAQVVGRKVSWDNRKTNPGKGDYWAPCPFHQEKTASFHVDDRKGFYYCFGCHAKGDALSFVRETENMGFMEAVETLAREAGMQMPAQDPKAAERAAQRASLADVMEAAVQFTRMQLHAAAAAEARDYLARRGLTEDTLTRFEIGFASQSRGAMTAHLRAKQIPEADIVAAGLAIKPDDGGAAFDRFRDRIMFPIRDARGRAIGFGGRAMSPDARAKYLNSPETPLFDKGRALYNYGPAREAAGKAGHLVVTEGYMDVIALVQAGIAHAVAPLGTAITEEQLRLMWRIADEPVIALDGDQAGLRAAMRVMDVALPLLEAGKSLRFCLMPEGLDPDDLIRAEGAGAMQTLLEDAIPMVDLLWRRETEGHVYDSPERRAALDARLREVVGRIADPVLKTHYREALRERRAALFRPAAPAPAPGAAGGRGGPRGGGYTTAGGRWTPPPAGPSPGTKASLLAQQVAAGLAPARVRESAILAGCLTHPEVAEAVEADLERVTFHCADLDALRRALLQCLARPLSDGGQGAGALIAALAAMGRPDPMPDLLRIGQVRHNPHLGADAAHGAALAAVREELAKHRALSGARAELAEAETEITGLADEGLTWRLQQAGAARNQSLRGTAGAAGGAETEDRAALTAQLQEMIDSQVWRKRKK